MRAVSLVILFVAIAASYQFVEEIKRQVAPQLFEKRDHHENICVRTTCNGQGETCYSQVAGCTDCTTQYFTCANNPENSGNNTALCLCEEEAINCFNEVGKCTSTAVFTKNSFTGENCTLPQIDNNPILSCEQDYYCNNNTDVGECIPRIPVGDECVDDPMLFDQCLEDFDGFWISCEQFEGQDDATCQIASQSQGNKDPCTFDAQCVGAGVCEDGNCVQPGLGEECQGGDCLIGLYCLDNNCTETKNPGEECSTSAECNSMIASCVNEICILQHSLDAGEACYNQTQLCKFGLWCYEGECAPQEESIPACTEDAECQEKFGSQSSCSCNSFTGDFQCSAQMNPRTECEESVQAAAQCFIQAQCTELHIAEGSCFHTNCAEHIGCLLDCSMGPIVQQIIDAGCMNPINAECNFDSTDTDGSSSSAVALIANFAVLLFAILVAF